MESKTVEQAKEEGEVMSEVLDENTIESSLNTKNKIDRLIQGSVVRKRTQTQSLGVKKRVKGWYWDKIQHRGRCRCWHPD